MSDGSDESLRRMALARHYRWKPVGPRPPGERRAVKYDAVFRRHWIWRPDELEQLLERFESTECVESVAEAYGVSAGWMLQLIDKAIALRAARTRPTLHLPRPRRAQRIAGFLRGA